MSAGVAMQFRRARAKRSPGTGATELSAAGARRGAFGRRLELPSMARPLGLANAPLLDLLLRESRIARVTKMFQQIEVLLMRDSLRLPGRLLPDRVERDGLLQIARCSAPQRRAVVRVDSSVVARAAQRDVELLTIHELGAASGIDVDDDAIDRGALGCVRGGGVAVIDMPKFGERGM